MDDNRKTGQRAPPSVAATMTTPTTATNVRDARETGARAHGERNDRNDEELMDNVMRPRDEEGCILYCILYTK